MASPVDNAVLASRSAYRLAEPRAIEVRARLDCGHQLLPLQQALAVGSKVTASGASAHGIVCEQPLDLRAAGIRSRLIWAGRVESPSRDH